MVTLPSALAQPGAASHRPGPGYRGRDRENDSASGYVTPLMTWLDSQQTSYLAWVWNAYFHCSSGPGLISGCSGTLTSYGGVEVLVAGIRIGGQVPHDSQDGVADDDHRASLHAAAPGDAILAVTYVGLKVGAGACAGGWWCPRGRFWLGQGHRSG
jgi:hypothetical protein